MTNTTKTVLIDMDGVLCDWNASFGQRILARAPHLNFPFLKDNASWDLHAGLTPEASDVVREVMAESGFYADLTPIEGAREALIEMKEAGHTIFMVTSPFSANPTCASDKITWLNKYIGPGWGRCAVITDDKTIVRGDILIDDKPEIIGAMDPTWEHVLFHAPYNRDINDGRRRLTDWKDWREIING